MCLHPFLGFQRLVNRVKKKSFVSRPSSFVSGRRHYMRDTPSEPMERGDLAGKARHVPDWRELRFDDDFNVGLVIGASSSGKTMLLRHCFGEPASPCWDQNAVVSQFADPASGTFDNKGAADEAIDRLSSVGLGSIPTWMRPYECMSNGEQARARLARQINDGAPICPGLVYEDLYAVLGL